MEIIPGYLKKNMFGYILIFLEIIFKILNNLNKKV